MSKTSTLNTHPLRTHPSNQQWYRSLAIIFRDNRPLLVRSLLNSGKIVEGKFENDVTENDFNSELDRTTSRLQDISRNSSQISIDSSKLVRQGTRSRESTISQSQNSTTSTVNLSITTDTQKQANASNFNKNSEINYLDWTIFTSLDSIDFQLNRVDSNNNFPSKNTSGDSSRKKGGQQAGSQAHPNAHHLNPYHTANSFQNNSNYIGILQPSDTHKIHGYVTASRIKFILLLDSSKPMPRDNDIKIFFENLHQIWMKLTANPFYKPGKVIKNMPKFVKMVDGLLLKL